MHRLALALLLCAPTAFAEPTKPVQAQVQLDQPAVKVVTITIAPGATLPVHTTPVHATVVAMSGSGTVSIADKTVPLPEHGVVFLPKQIPHGVQNPGKTPLVLSVHHLKGT